MHVFTDPVDISPSGDGWATVDVSSHFPSDFDPEIVWCFHRDGGYQDRYGFRYPGSTLPSTGSTAAGYGSPNIAGTDAGSLEVRADGDVTAWLLGGFSTQEAVSIDPYSVDPSSSGTWETYNYGSSGLVCVEMVRTDFDSGAYRRAAARQPGRTLITTDRIRSTKAALPFSDSNGDIEIYTQELSNPEFWIVGHVETGDFYQMSGENVSPSTNQTWETVQSADARDIDESAVVYLRTDYDYDSEEKDWAARSVNNGSWNPIYDIFHSWFPVELDSSNQFEAWLENIGTGNYEHELYVHSTHSTADQTNPDPQFNVQIDSTNEPVGEGEDLNVDFTVNNDSEAADTQTIELWVGDFMLLDEFNRSLASEWTEHVPVTYFDKRNARDNVAMNRDGGGITAPFISTQYATFPQGFVPGGEYVEMRIHMNEYGNYGSFAVDAEQYDDGSWQFWSLSPNDSQGNTLSIWEYDDKDGGWTLHASSGSADYSGEWLRCIGHLTGGGELQGWLYDDDRNLLETVSYGTINYDTSRRWGFQSYDFGDTIRFDFVQAHSDHPYL